jgi:hypothetical protein
LISASFIVGCLDEIAYKCDVMRKDDDLSIFGESSQPGGHMRTASVIQRRDGVIQNHRRLASVKMGLGEVSRQSQSRLLSLAEHLGDRLRYPGSQESGLMAQLTNSDTALLDRQGVGIAEKTRVVAALYTGILRVHPFADGNHRTAFVALSAALWSLGLPAVEFAHDKDMTDHDSAVAPALISPDGDVDPFARLLTTRIEHARKPAT